MLLKRPVLDGIASGDISLVFRRWTRPTVKSGGTLKTAIGVLAIDEVARIAAADLTEAAARAAGYTSVATLKRDLASRPDGDLYRIRVRHVGADPRIALRAQDALDADDVQDLTARLQRLDKAEPWTRRVLDLIAAHPGRRAAELAERVGQETLPFKARVRKLKALGLTESLEVGYRLSPRGEALRKALKS